MSPGYHVMVLVALTLLMSTSSRILPYDDVSIPGPIKTNGKNFTKVCDPDHFRHLGLDMLDFAYCDSSLPYPERIKDLVGRMTVKEKIMNLGDGAPGVPRIGLPLYNYWSEALHGVSWVGKGTKFNSFIPSATVFPTPILTVASFNESLWKLVGQSVSTEARAMYNLGQSGLTFWSPNINVARDPRWGRTMETPGEDPFVVSRYGVNYMRGLQDVEGQEYAEDPNTRPLKVSACCKHYTAYDLDSWFDHMIYRQAFDARVTMQDMVETFDPPFEACVREGDGSSIMCSFNNINGIPVCADARILSQTIRGEWDLHGYIVSDCASTQVIHQGQKWLSDTAEDAVAQVIQAGLDLDCGYGNVHYFQSYGESAIRQGKVRESDLDNALKNLYTVLMRAGFFDGNEAFADLGLKDICSKEHIELSREVATQSIVLLKNDGDTLPLDPNKFKNVAAIGPLTDATVALRANYPGISCRDVSPLEGLQSAVQADFQRGCNDVMCNSIDDGAVRNSASQADATIIFVGLDPNKIEAEGHDRDLLWLPGRQAELIHKATDASKGPVILVILSGTCVDISFARDDPKVGAIVWAGYPGEQGGNAIADVIFGRVNPAGKLANTWYHSDFPYEVPMTSMQLRPIKELGYPGRTYKFFDGSLQFPFGHGLSYTQFKYTLITSVNSITAARAPHQKCKQVTYKPNVEVPACPGLAVKESSCLETIDFAVEVANIGPMDGANVLIVYSKPPVTVDDAPIKKVVAFERVFVPAGQSRTVKFSLNACKALALVEKTAYVVLPFGKSTIVVNNDEVVSFPVDVSFSY